MIKVRSRLKQVLAISAVLAFGAGLAACGSDSDSGEESGPGSAIEGRTWELMNIATQGSASSLPNTVDAPTLEFEDGDVQVFAGCNSGSGPAEIGETTIEFGPIALTKKACQGVASQLEQYVGMVLRGEVDYEVNQGNLVLEGSDLTLVLKPAE